MLCSRYALAFALAVASCSSAPVVPVDAAVDTAAAPDAPAPLDAPAPDAPAIDAPAPDAPASDAATPHDAPDAAACSVDAPVEPGTVRTDRGAVRGERAGALYVYRGIPYAAPPVGRLRWRAPEPAACWSGVQSASRFGAICTQLNGAGAVVGSEDCLTLNVWAPAVAPAAPLPVMVFLHGGSNVAGSSSVRLLGVDAYDGANLAERGPVVVVTLNYRLGAMGFLAHPSLAAENDRGAAGNYGLMDQLAALRWVQRNAGAFGGDPRRVTLFGQSAGAFDTCLLVASRLGAGLFARAAIHSGGCGAALRATAERNAVTVAGRLGCDTGSPSAIATCLRDASAVRVAGATTSAETGSGSFYPPTVDGYVIDESPIATIRAGRHNRVPLIFGSTTDEMTQFVRAFEPAPLASDEAYRAAVVRRFGAAGAPILLGMYPSAAYPSPQRAFEALLADLVFVCPTRRAARAAAAGQREPVRRFVFSHVFSSDVLRPFGAAHGYELFFLFRRDGGAVTFDPAERALGETLTDYWTRFAATGDPNGAPGAPVWPVYDPAADSFLTLDTPIAPGAGARTSQCDFWDRYAE